MCRPTSCFAKCHVNAKTSCHLSLHKPRCTLSHSQSLMIQRPKPHQRDSALQYLSMLLHTSHMNQCLYSQSPPVSAHVSAQISLANMADKTFVVTELLEAVLYQLPMKDLLFAQKVCSHWKAVIDTSDKLQKALFMKPGVAADAPAEALRIPTARRKDFPAGGVAINSLLCFEVTARTSSVDAKAEIVRSALRPNSIGTVSCERMYTTQPPTKLSASYGVKFVSFIAGWSFECALDEDDLQGLCLKMLGDRNLTSFIMDSEFCGLAEVRSLQYVALRILGTSGP